MTRLTVLMMSVFVLAGCASERQSSHLAALFMQHDTETVPLQHGYGYLETNQPMNYVTSSSWLANGQDTAIVLAAIDAHERSGCGNNPDVVASR